ncbi:MAG: DDE-type integrase/transposase/recombinase [Clostridium sp.]|nr:DDE-type integrase/transposase/recombinase [Clostridium sp.]
MDDKLKEKVALFRFSLIAPIINNTFTEPTIKAYLESICVKLYDVPHLGKREYAPATIKSWYLAYRKNGIEALYPSQRSDKGNSRSLNEATKEYIIDAKIEHPQRSGKSIYHELIARGMVASDDVSLSTVQRFIQKRGLNKLKTTAKDRRIFEMEFPGDCWQTDISTGPYLNIDGKKVKTYLIAFIDDASRAIMAASFSFDQSLVSVLSVFKTAVQRRGIPKKLFMDNGKVFRSDQLQFICASLGTIVSYAEVFSPESKGKVERWFQTLQRQWMNLLDWRSISSIDQLNELLYDYVENQYHQAIHSSIKAKPIDKYTTHIDRIRFVHSKQELDSVFLYRVTRKVKNDATISISNILYEVPMEFIGEQIKVRYDPSQMDKAYIFDDDGKCLSTVYPVNKIDNSKIIRDRPKDPIDFSPFNLKEVAK